VLDLHVGHQDDRDVHCQDQLGAADDRQDDAGPTADALLLRRIAH
jgi:hypothetical protein